VINHEVMTTKSNKRFWEQIWI